MNRVTRILLALLLLSPLNCAYTAQDPAAPAKTIAPFIDAQTIAVGRIEIARVEVDPLIDQLVELIPDADREQEQMRTGLKQVKGQFAQAGVDEVYFGLSLADVPHQSPAFLVVPAAEAAKAKALAEKLPRPGEDWRAEPLGGAVVIAQSLTLERLKKIQPSERPQLADAFRAAADSAVQVILLPTNDHRRVIEELMPTLPAEVGGGPSTILTRGVEWLALGIDPPPKLSLNLFIQSQDAAAAEALQAKLREIVSILSELAADAGAPEELAQAFALLVPEVKHDRLALQLSEADRSVRALLVAVGRALEGPRARAKRQQSMNNLKQLGIAMHNYHDLNKRFPGVGAVDADGKPLLSWRVHVLPFVDEQRLYDQFRLDEPWDSQHNRQLIEKMPRVFHSPVSEHAPGSGLTVYREVTGERTVFPGPEGIEYKQITDGTSNTIMLVEVDDEHAVVWTKPEGLPYNADHPRTGLGGQYEEGFLAVFCDGSARLIPSTVPDETLRRLLIRDDGQVIPQF